MFAVDGPPLRILDSQSEKFVYYAGLTESMDCRFISRRRFIESSITGGLAVGFGLKAEPLPGATSDALPAMDGLTLEVTGDAKQGYGASLFFNGQPVIRHNHGGEFSAVFQNEERSVEDRVSDWKAASWAGDATHLTLDGECKLKNLNTTVFVQVSYERITPVWCERRSGSAKPICSTCTTN
jgi:hypothetical protein